MTRKEAIEMMHSQLECITRSIAGCNEVCEECDLNYDQGNMGEHREYMRMAIRAMKTLDKIEKIIHDECYNHVIVNIEEVMAEMIHYPIWEVAAEIVELSNTLYKVVEALKEVEDGSQEDRGRAEGDLREL